MIERAIAEEVEEIMARAMCFDEGNHCRQPGCEEARRCLAQSPETTDRARAAIAALHAHGYKITKDDPDMLSIPEVSTDRPIGG